MGKLGIDGDGKFFLQKEFDWLENFEGVSSLGIILN